MSVMDDYHKIDRCHKFKCFLKIFQTSSNINYKYSTNLNKSKTHTSNINLAILH